MSLLLLWGQQALASPFTAGRLAEHAREYDKYVAETPGTKEASVGVFMGYVIALVDVHSGQLDVTEDATMDQAFAVVSKFLREHPETWDKPARGVVSKALMTALGRAARKSSQKP